LPFATPDFAPTILDLIHGEIRLTTEWLPTSHVPQLCDPCFARFPRCDSTLYPTVERCGTADGGGGAISERRCSRNLVAFYRRGLVTTVTMSRDGEQTQYGRTNPNLRLSAVMNHSSARSDRTCDFWTDGADTPACRKAIYEAMKAIALPQ
jgi:hypothetical protein